MSTNELDDLYINDYVDKVADPEEVLMRADFARVQEMRNNMPYVETEADEIAVRWSSRHDDLGAAWRYLRAAHDDWERSPKAMRRFHEQVDIDQSQGVHVLSGIEWRSQQQARELTGHGFWSESLTEADRAPILGHACAGLVNVSDREQEMEG
jgi:hypothetical protein